MARPRTITDEQILGTMRASVLEHGPAVSLDFVAEKLGVTGPALLKRFGSRQKLMIEALKPPEVPTWVEHHRALDHLLDGGCALVDVAHWASEQPWCNQVAGLLRARFGAALPVAVSDIRTDPWNIDYRRIPDES